MKHGNFSAPVVHPARQECRVPRAIGAMPDRRVNEAKLVKALALDLQVKVTVFP